MTDSSLIVTVPQFLISVEQLQALPPEFLERTLSVLATCRQQGKSELAYLQAATAAHFAGQPAPELL